MSVGIIQWTINKRRFPMAERPESQTFKAKRDLIANLYKTTSGVLPSDADCDSQPPPLPPRPTIKEKTVVVSNDEVSGADRTIHKNSFSGSSNHNTQSTTDLENNKLFSKEPQSIKLESNLPPNPPPKPTPKVPPKLPPKTHSKPSQNIISSLHTIPSQNTPLNSISNLLQNRHSNDPPNLTTNISHRNPPQNSQFNPHSNLHPNPCQNEPPNLPTKFPPLKKPAKLPLNVEAEENKMETTAMKTEDTDKAVTDSKMTLNCRQTDSDESKELNHTVISPRASTENKMENMSTDGNNGLCFLNPERLSYASCISEIHLFLIGKTGNGKSAVGNTILGRKHFTSKSSSTSVTALVSTEKREYNGILINVADGPGVCETRYDEEQAMNMVIDALSQAVTINPNGFHAFLLVVRFGGRFTREDQITIEVLKKIFGKSFVRKFCILVMTHGDLFEAEETGTFEDWIKGETGILAELVSECDHRVILFDNKTNDEEKKDRQMNDLLHVTYSLIAKNCRYTNEQFDLAKTARDAIILENKKQIISDNIMKEASLILDELKDFQSETENENNVPPLQNLLTRAEELQKFIVAQDNETGVLQELINHVISVQESIKNEIKFAERITAVLGKFRKVNEETSKAFAKELNKQRKEFDECYIEGRMRQKANEMKLEDELSYYREKEKLWEEEKKQRNERMEKTENLDKQLHRIKRKNNQSVIQAIQKKVYSAFKTKLSEKGNNNK